MRGILGLTNDFVTRLEEDGLLAAVMGVPVKVYTERPPSSTAMPFLVLDFLDQRAWNNQSYRGTDYLVQVSAFFAREEGGTARGIADVAAAAERVRDLFDDVDGFDLPAQQPPSESLILSFGDERYEQNTGEHRLVMRQYVTAPAFTGEPGLYMAGIVRFRCLVGE